MGTKTKPAAFLKLEETPDGIVVSMQKRVRDRLKKEIREGFEHTWKSIYSKMDKSPYIMAGCSHGHALIDDPCYVTQTWVCDEQDPLEKILLEGQVVFRIHQDLDDQDYECTYPGCDYGNLGIFNPCPACHGSGIYVRMPIPRNPNQLDLFENAAHAEAKV